jgi:N-acetylneuraminate synthase
MPSFKIGAHEIGPDSPVYFVADISANHDGDLGRAIDLIHLCAEKGADAAKFQNFRAPKIVSNRGFTTLTDNSSHQARWGKSVYSVYQQASLPWEWTETLKKECDAAGIDYFSTPYDFEAVNMLDPFVSAFKIGSGDITWPEMLLNVASRKKPVILATGASSMTEVIDAVATMRSVNSEIGLMQCNTNYTGSLENFKHIHLNVLKAYAVMFPDVVLGLSDHTPGHSTVLGAVALGARLIEKHFTDDNSRVGPDHPFSMSPTTWREMVDRTRELEYALGDPVKVVAGNEKSTVVVQRRCLRAASDLPVGTVLTRSMIDVLRPAPAHAIVPYHLDSVLGRRLRTSLAGGDELQWSMLEEA